MTEELKQDDEPLAHLPKETTIDAIASAYIDGLVTGHELVQPVFVTTALLKDGRWLRVTFTATHEWVEGVPPEVEALRAQGGMQ